MSAARRLARERRAEHDRMLRVGVWTAAGGLLGLVGVLTLWPT